MILYFCKLILLHLLLHSKEKEKYKSKINKAKLNAKQSMIVAKLERSTIDMLHQLYSKIDRKIFKVIKFSHLTEEQYVVKKDTANMNARKCETYVNQLEALLYCEEEKLNIAKYQKQWVSEQLQVYLQMLCDVKYVLANLKKLNVLNTECEKMCNCK